jgi:hypothetical protein
MKGMMLYKDTRGGSIKDVDTKEGVITGYFSVFGNKDSDGDIILPGAFSKTLKENGPESGNHRILYLLQHDPERVLGKPSVLKEDGHGLYFESKITPTSYGRDTLKLYEDGVLTEHSIGYRVVKNEPKSDANYLQELRLWEGSAVSWGANSEALFVGMKAEDKPELYEKLIKKLEALNHAIKGGLTDDTIIQLELQIKQLQQAIVSLAEIEKPVESTSAKSDEPIMSASDMVAIVKSKIK